MFLKKLVEFIGHTVRVYRALIIRAFDHCPFSVRACGLGFWEIRPQDIIV
jgi:hypothetical protein